MNQWSPAEVNIDYHVTFDANLYSVPSNLVHELVEIRSTPTTVEILLRGPKPLVSQHASRKLGNDGFEQLLKKGSSEEFVGRLRLGQLAK